MTSYLRSLPGVFTGAFLGLSLAAAIPSCKAQDACVEGSACICESDCSEDCEGAGCGFTCEAGVSCDFHCPEGGCGVTCDPNSECNLDCDGGNCSMTCSEGAKCNIDECAGGACIMSCGDDAAECNNACGIEAGCITD